MLALGSRGSERISGGSLHGRSRVASGWWLPTRLPRPTATTGARCRDAHGEATPAPIGHSRQAGKSSSARISFTISVVIGGVLDGMEKRGKPFLSNADEGVREASRPFRAHSEITAPRLRRCR